MDSEEIQDDRAFQKFNVQIKRADQLSDQLPQTGVKMHSAKKTYDGKIAGLYDLEETLGRGHFAVVKLARHVFTGEKVAVKVIDKTKLDEVSRAHLFQEVRCMKLVQHPNVVRLYEVIDTQTKLYLILELGDGGDLYDYIMKHEAGLGEDMAKEYFRQIVRAISYCHQLHVVHRDLKPENVVFFERLGVVKLTDFGFSNKFCPGQKLDTSCGSLAYSAPEILLGDSYDAPAVDVWSLGVILYMLVAGQAPFQEANDSETLTMIMDCKYTIPTHVSESCKRLIAKMLVREPESRATLEDIASDPWLGGPPQVEYLPLVSRHQVTEEDHNIIINKMVNGNIATKEEVLEALDRNEYNHITATYFLLAERKLRTYRQEQAQSRLKPSQALVSISTPKNSLGKANSEDSALSEDIRIAQGSRLNVPRAPGETAQGKVRKCSIVQEEEDEEEYCSVGSGQELTPPHSSLNRRGSRSEGKLNVAIQERIAEERRKEKKESPSTSPHPSNVGRVGGAKDDASWPSKRTSPTSIHSGIPASYIPGSGTWRVVAGKTSPSDGKEVRLNVNNKRDDRNAMGEPAADPVSRTSECVTSDSNKEDKHTDKVINSSQLKTSPKAVSPKIRLTRENSEFSAVSLKDSATITIPFHSPSSGSSLGPKFKTLPSPTRNPHSLLSSHEIFEGIPELTVSGSGDSCGGEGRTSGRLGVSSINYEQRRSKFHKARTASCSSSDASDDDSESRKKRAHKISIEKNNQRRDSHDDSSDGQDRGGDGGAGGNPASGLGSGGDGMQNENESNGNQGNRSTEGGNSSGSGNNRQQRQCNGENFRRNRRRTGETRLRESQSLNRIMEVQESEGGHYSITTAEVFTERLEKSAGEGRKALASNSNGNINNVEKGKSAKSLGARFLQSWSNTISSTKLSVQKRKYEAEGRSPRAGSETRASELSEHYSKHYSDEKENKAVIEKTGKKMKVLGRYFQVSKKLCIPLPSLSAKGRLYKARSCGSIGKDRITSPTTPTTCASSTLKPSANGTAGRIGVRGRSKSPNVTVNQSGKESRDSSNSPKKSPLKSPVKFKQGKNKTEDPGGGGGRHIQDEPKESYNKNLANGGGGGLYDCPNVGLCRTHMRDAAKCHLS